MDPVGAAIMPLSRADRHGLLEPPWCGCVVLKRQVRTGQLPGLNQHSGQGREPEPTTWLDSWTIQAVPKAI
jgi:hypothetical protein